MFSVYALLEPIERGSYIRYVGLTKMTLEQRLQGHLSKAKTNTNHRCNWIKKLSSNNLVPQIICLYDNLTKQEACMYEIELIEYFLYIGAKLTNSTLGGEGCWGYRHSAETIRKISKLKFGMHVGDMNPNYGNKNDETVRRKMAVCRAKKLLPKDVTNIRKKLAEGMKHKEIAKQFDVSRTIITRIKSGTRYALVGEQL